MFFIITLEGNTNIMNESIAHIRQEDRSTQSVKNHLIQVSIIASQNASKIGLSKAGELLGLLHDLGKYSQVFQNYIGSSSGIINHDADEYVDSELLKGKIDHSTAGAKFIWDRCLNEGAHNQIFALLFRCVVS